MSRSSTQAIVKVIIILTQAIVKVIIILTHYFTTRQLSLGYGYHGRW